MYRGFKNLKTACPTRTGEQLTQITLCAATGGEEDGWVGGHLAVDSNPTLSV